MLGIFLSFLVSLTLCELPPAGYIFPLVSQSVGTAYDVKFVRPETYEVYTITGKTVVITRDPGLSPVDFPAVAPRTTDLSTEFGLDVDGIDTAFVRSNGMLYIFKGSLVWRYSSSWAPAGPGKAYTLVSTYPHKIENEFQGLPNDLSASLALPNNHIYFFKNDDYYLVRDATVYKNVRFVAETKPLMDRVETCYPKKVNTQFELPAGTVWNAHYSFASRNIHFTVKNGAVVTEAVVADKYNLHKFHEVVHPVEVNPDVKMCVSALPIPPGSQLPAKYDAIFQRKTGKIYIFSGDLYWRLTDRHFNPQLHDCLDAGYPKLIADNFKNPNGPALPTPINAVFQRDNGKIYFFVGSDYYRFTDKYILPEADPTQPDQLDVIIDPPNLTYPQPLSNFGLTAAQYANHNVVGVFQRPNGRVFIFLKDKTSGAITYFRITDKYVTGVENDVVDPGWDTSANGYPVAPDFKGLVTPFDVVYQRSESDQQIYFHTGNSHQTAFDRYIHLPSVCTACNSNSDGQ